MFTKAEMKVFFLRYGVDIGKYNYPQYVPEIEKIVDKIERDISASSQKYDLKNGVDAKRKHRYDKRKGNVNYLPLKESEARNLAPFVIGNNKSLEQEIRQMSDNGCIACKEVDVEIPRFAIERLKLKNKNDPDGSVISFASAQFNIGQLFEKILGLEAERYSCTMVGYIKDIGLVLFRAEDYVSLGMDVYIVKETVNSFVKEKPAAFKVLVGPSGNKRVFLSWVCDHNYCQLQVWNGDLRLDELKDKATQLAEKLVDLVDG